MEERGEALSENLCNVSRPTDKLDQCRKGHTELTLSPPIPFRIYTLPYWSNPPVLISDIQALWRSGLSARVSECQKIKLVG